METAVFRYQWFAATDFATLEFHGETSSTYTLGPLSEGLAIKVKVSFTDDRGHSETLTSAATEVVIAADPNSEPTGLPTIDGTPQVGETLTADTSAIDDEDGLTNVAYSYQWVGSKSVFDDDTGTSYILTFEIPGQAGSTYTLAPADEGWTFEVKVSFTDDAGNAESLTSAATGEVEAKPNTTATGLPNISGTPQVGETLTADTSDIDDEDGLTNATFEYQWIAGRSDINGATGSSHLLTTSEQGQTIQVKVTFTDDADNQESLTSAETLAVAARPNTAATGEPTISGTPQVDETLTADTSAISDEDGLGNVSYQYQWLRDDAEIAGATGSTYILADADQGKTIRVRVTFRDDADNAESLTSMATTAVAAQPTSLLTASFANVPADHDGSNFTFDLNFSENVNAGYARIQDDAFTVSGGAIASASRKTQGSNQGWNVEVNPTGNGAVSITLPETTDCDASGAICTEDSRKLSHPTSATVAGPPTISVSDATVQEAEGAVLVFTATLSHASSRTVTVDYATSDGTAVAGSDYTAASGTLTFNAGDTSQTVQVTVLTDSEDESQETLTLTLSNPSQATLDDATGTGTIENGESSSGTQEDPPAEDPPAETPVVLLTASFANVPADHDGSNFTFDLNFSENVNAGYARIRDDAFTVSGGAIASASRKTQGSNQGWTVEVNPTGNGAVSITLPETTDCDASGAICTDDSRKLSQSTSATVAGPPAIAVSDATVQEAEGAVLVFTATLSHASSRTVTVDYATSDGTAVAGSDYTAASGTLTFNAGDTSQTVQVTVLTDSEDESQETLTLTLSNPSQATLDDATGTGTIENGESSSGTQEDPPAEDPPAETPVVLLTASFGNMPATHNGSLHLRPDLQRGVRNQLRDSAGRCLQCYGRRGDQCPAADPGEQHRVDHHRDARLGRRCDHRPARHHGLQRQRGRLHRGRQEALQPAGVHRFRAGPVGLPQEGGFQATVKHPGAQTRKSGGGRRKRGGLLASPLPKARKSQLRKWRNRLGGSRCDETQAPLSQGEAQAGDSMGTAGPTQHLSERTGAPLRDFPGIHVPTDAGGTESIGATAATVATGPGR